MNNAKSTRVSTFALSLTANNRSRCWDFQWEHYIVFFGALLSYLSLDYCTSRLHLLLVPAHLLRSRPHEEGGLRHTKLRCEAHRQAPVLPMNGSASYLATQLLASDQRPREDLQFGGDDHCHLVSVQARNIDAHKLTRRCIRGACTTSTSPPRPLLEHKSLSS